MYTFSRTHVHCDTDKGKPEEFSDPSDRATPPVRQAPPVHSVAAERRAAASPLRQRPPAACSSSLYALLRGFRRAGGEAQSDETLILIYPSLVLHGYHQTLYYYYSPYTTSTHIQAMLFLSFLSPVLLHHFFHSLRRFVHQVSQFHTILFAQSNVRGGGIRIAGTTPA